MVHWILAAFSIVMGLSWSRRERARACRCDSVQSTCRSSCSLYPHLPLQGLLKFKTQVYPSYIMTRLSHHHTQHNSTQHTHTHHTHRACGMENEAMLTDANEAVDQKLATLQDPAKLADPKQRGGRAQCKLGLRANAPGGSSGCGGEEDRPTEEGQALMRRRWRRRRQQWRTAQLAIVSRAQGLGFRA